MPYLEAQTVDIDKEESGESQERVCLEGSDGMIDERALAVIARQGKVAEVLAELMTRSRMWLPDGSALVWDEGRIWTASACLPASGFSWMLMTVTAVVGRPVTVLIYNPNLTPGMIVMSVHRDIDGGLLPVTADLGMLARNFGGSTGEVC